MKVLMILLTILLFFSVSVAEEFDPSLYIIEEGEETSQNTEEVEFEEEFNPNLYIETSEEKTQIESDSSNIEEFNPEVYVEESHSSNIQEVQDDNAVSQSEENIVIIENPIEDVQEESILVTPSNQKIDSSTNIMLIGFGLAIVSLMLLILLYAVHYYREKHHLK